MITPAYRCQLVRERSISTDAQLTSSAAAKQVAIELLKDSPSEVFVTVLLDVKNRVIGVAEITRGTLDASLVHPREVFRPAILANCASIIIAHNHPSGDLTPSSEDWAVFEKIKSAGDVLGIGCLDSLIVSDIAAASMAEIRQAA